MTSAEVNREGPAGQRPAGAAVPGSYVGRKPGGGRRKRGGRGETPMVPDAHFTSYYGRPIVKPTPWEADIPAYLFLGGLAAGSSLLSAGADLTARATLRRTGRVAALVAISGSMAALVHDLGRPTRFLNMLRVAKPTSPMSVGTWLLTPYGGLVAVTGLAELRGLLPAKLAWASKLLGALGRPAGLGAAVLAPTIASYTAVLLADTATPSWHEAHRELPFVFVGSASAAAGGLGMLASSLADAGPARSLAAGGAVLELVAEQVMERSMGMTAEPLHTGTPGRLMRASKILTALGAAGAVLVAPRSRIGAAASGLALLAGSVCTRFGVFEAGLESARDPKYTVVPQRQRLDRRIAAEGDRTPA
jgi:hypothetical protein